MSKTLFEIGLQWAYEAEHRRHSKELLEQKKSPEEIDVKRKKETEKSEGHEMTLT